MCPRGALHGIKDLEGFFCYASGRIGTDLKAANFYNLRSLGMGKRHYGIWGNNWGLSKSFFFWVLLLRTGYSLYAYGCFILVGQMSWNSNNEELGARSEKQWAGVVWQLWKGRSVAYGCICLKKCRGSCGTLVSSNVFLGFWRGI